MLGSPTINQYPDIDFTRHVNKKGISPNEDSMLEAIPSDEEIKNGMFSINSNKAPGPDGFNTHFFQT